MTEDECLRLCDLNYAQSWRDVVSWRTEGALADEDDLLLGATTSSSAGFNRALRTGHTARPDAHEVLARAQAYFSARQRGFVVEARAHTDTDLIDLARARGLEPLREPLPVMVLDHIVDEPALAPSIALRVVDDATGLADFAATASTAFAALGLPIGILADLLATPERIRAPHITILVAYEGATPLATGFSMLSHGIAGLYWIGTVPAAGRRGLGGAITRRLGNLALARGAAFVVLQASAQGRRLYERIGYRTVTHYHRFLVPYTI